MVISRSLEIVVDSLVKFIYLLRALQRDYVKHELIAITNFFNMVANCTTGAKKLQNFLC